MNRTVMVVAGEVSGDQYGARLIAALRARVPGIRVFGIGGDRMESEGMELLYHVRQTSIMGFVEVVRHYPFLRRMFSRSVAALRERQPAAVVLIDYPGFNLRFARRARAAGVPVVYYISPQVWAWGKDRAAKMKPLVDRLAVVFPFEEALFRAAGIPTAFVGHPLLEILPSVERSRFLAAHRLPDARILALFPGSRVQEIDRILPVMLAAASAIRERAGCTVAIGAAPIEDAVYERHLRSHPGVRLLRDATHGLMQHAHAAVVTSGTATVETAYYQTPMVIVYRTSRLNFEIGKRLIRVSEIGMANILAGKRVVPELVQDELTEASLVRECLRYFEDEEYAGAVRAELARVRAAMGTPGASQRVADIVVSIMEGTPPPAVRGDTPSPSPPRS